MHFCIEKKNKTKKIVLKFKCVVKRIQLFVLVRFRFLIRILQYFVYFYLQVAFRKVGKLK